jgi:hypothetical protein
MIYRAFREQIDWEQFWDEIKDYLITLINGRSTSLFLITRKAHSFLYNTNAEGVYLLRQQPIYHFNVGRATFDFHFSCGDPKIESDFIEVPSHIFAVIETSIGPALNRAAQSLYDEYWRKCSEPFMITGYKC